MAKRKIKARWVVKAGSHLVCTGGPLLLRAWARQAAVLRAEHGIELIWVTSGAIASAIERNSARRAGARRVQSLSEKQALSAMGQPIVMDHYRLAFATERIDVAQILLTYSDLAQVSRRENFVRTVNQLLAWNVLPVLNENDAVSTEEIRFGDNDALSAKVARAISADRLVILTDVDGLYDRDPKRNKNANLISKIKANIKSIDVGAKGSWRSVGGMRSKIEAAQFAVRSAIQTWLVRGDAPNVLLSVAEERNVGTCFLPK